MRFASPASGPGKASPASLVNSKGESYDIDGFGVIALRQGDCDRLPRYRVENRGGHCSPPSLGHSPNTRVSPHIPPVGGCGGGGRAGGWFRPWPARGPPAVGGWAGSTMVSLVAGLLE